MIEPSRLSKILRKVVPACIPYGLIAMIGGTDGKSDVSDRLLNMSRNQVIAEKLNFADTFLLRAKGLLGTEPLNEDEALIIIPCSSIHTFGMKYEIDVLFVDDMNEVVKTQPRLKPNRAVASATAWYVVELPAGTIEKTKTTVGDVLHWEG